MGFYEDDENVDDLLAAFDAGDQGLTTPPLPGGAVIVTAPGTFAPASSTTRQVAGSIPVLASA